jgi:sulfatase modifying factor 1
MSGIIPIKKALARVLMVAGLVFGPCFSGDVVAGDKARRVVRIRNESSVSSAIPLVSIETVAVGDPGNQAALVNGASVGSVAASYRIGKYEVTIAEYAAFLNAVATRGDGANAPVIESLYDSRMLSDGNIAGISRNGSGTAAVPYAYFVVGDGKKPISYITWFNAARFANWMHNGASANADIETGAYTLNGALSGTFTKNAGAVWWIPTQDEWFKAAYYKGGGTASGYWLFPTQSDSLPQNNNSSESNQANFLRLGVLSVTQSSTQDAAQNYLTAVGTFINSPSAYGTFDQGGNIEEWTDSVVSTDFGQARFTRGGAWNSGGLNNDVAIIPTALPSDRLSKVGFRLARAALADGAPVNLSGVITVRIVRGPPDIESPETLAPRQVVQYSVQKGDFTIEARDAQNESVVATGTFKTLRSDRWNLITVAVSGSRIVIGSAPEGTFF